VIKKIFSFREFRFKIEAGDKLLEKEFLLVIVNNSTTTGGGFLVTPKASLTDGKLDMVLCEKLSVWKRLRYLPVIENGKHTELPFIQYSQEAAVKISCDKAIFAQADGELISGASFDISVIKDGLLIKY
jgi:diacylglycerol kinase family enzyme